MIGDCPDCGRVELFRGRCRICGSVTELVGAHFHYRKLLWVRRLKLVKTEGKRRTVGVQALLRFPRG